MKRLITQIFGIIVLFLYVVCLFFASDIGLFSLNVLLAISIVLKARFSFFSIKTILIFYVLIPIAFQHWTGSSYGILEVSQLPLEFVKSNNIIFIYNIIIWFFICSSKILIKEKALFSKLNLLNSSYVIILSLMGIILIIIHYPPSFLTNGDRFDHLLPGNFWNHFSLICLLACLPNLTKSRFVQFSYIFFIFWCVIRSERVDALGLIIITFIYLLHSRNIKLIYFFIIIVPVLIAMVLIGVFRTGIKLDNLGEVIRSLVIQQTSSDIAYILNISIRHVEDFGYLFGHTYTAYIFDFIPISNNILTASELLNETYMHWGGIHLLSEPYMNFGYIGVIGFTMVECFAFYFIFNKPTKIRRLYAYFMYASIFRYCWYGIDYLFTGMIFLIPCIYLLTNKTKIDLFTPKSEVRCIE